jgi:hypothetical protein
MCHNKNNNGLNSIEKEFEKIGFIRGGLLLLGAKEAISLLNRLRIENISLLGIDGFFITKHTTQPSLEDSIDFTNSMRVPNKNVLIKEAIEFIEKRKNKNIYFEIVFENIND